jgi:superfamily II DNA or RNA helicase
MSTRTKSTRSAILRPHQAELRDRLYQLVNAGQRRIVAQAVTGFGKTILGADIARTAVDDGKRVIFVVPALSLIDQTVEKFYDNGVRDLGVIQANHPLTNYARPVQIASAQTLMRREIPHADVVMIDEVHRWFDFYTEWLAAPRWRDVPFIGLSATPWTRGLGRHFKQLVTGATTQALIDAGYLSPLRVFGPDSPDLTDVRTVAGDYHEGDLSEVMNGSRLVADVVDTWRRLGDGRPTLCFAVDRAHAKHLQQQFIESGARAEYIDAYTPASERDAIGRRFHAGEVDVVCNVGCLTTGVDWDVRCIILARPTKSEMLFVQMIGRGLRTAEGKDDCLILDHSDNHTRLGFVTDIHHDTLDDGRPRPKAAPKDAAVLPKKCPQCSFLRPPKTTTCPVCAFTPKPKCEIVNQDGELVEMASRLRVVETPKRERRDFYAEVRHIAAERNHKGGWAAHTYKAKFGGFPPWSWNDDPTATPSAATLRWVKSRMITYARARAS